MIAIGALAGVGLAAAAPADSPSFLFLLGDDIGWGDMGYNNGTANTPRINEWVKRKGTILMQDGHSGGTVCSPTRASVLTGRNPFRDCVNGVYGCSDITECDPEFPFAQHRTFTFPDAVHAAGMGYDSWFGGKWHLGNFKPPGKTKYPSSPLFHGFGHMNATLEVAPTATTNCDCMDAWHEKCNYGHDKKATHCSGGPPSSAPDLGKGCCFNYWWEDSSKEWGITNLTNPVGEDDSAYLSSAFEIFLAERKGKPFAAQISFHNCHIPYIGTDEARAKCKSGESCRPTNRRGDSSANYSDAELDFYACLNELDASVGNVLDALEREKYYDNTFIWFTTDNGPEGNCPKEGFCDDDHYATWPGDAGLLRGRKRDIWEGGHRVPTIVSWPAVVKEARVSWETVVTMDFLPTIMEVLGVQRPPTQQNWAMDGKSIMPILRGEAWAERGIGWMFGGHAKTNNRGYRYGCWKYVHGTRSCNAPDCKKELLFNLCDDLGETTDLADKYPDVLAAISANSTQWFDSIIFSIRNESKCPDVAVLEWEDV